MLQNGNYLRVFHISVRSVGETSGLDSFSVGETSRSRCARSAGALGCHTRIRAGFPRELHRQIMFLGPLGPTCL